ncbi:YeeE/YedE family protein [Piscinibacter sp.]|uniref:YeeE/YedE family protein n=1 Tax=Piscinibacter sp. TaxID=1903157 RepID=UPI002BC65295|nr:YeeE/YedE family protein [Albitalea sp.]HUG21927.1 YeeE/YedE family protein [Albitalea sp.]
MEDSLVQALHTQVLWAAFGLAAVFGAIAQRTHFCTMGAVSDIVLIGDWTRMRMWVMAMGVAIIGFNSMVALGWVDASKSLYGGPRVLWLSALVGGAMFGFGMVLASGCGSKTLVRLGGGNLKSLVVFIVLGLTAFATLKGITAVARVATVDAVAVTLPAGQDLPSLLAAAGGFAPTMAAAALGLALGSALIGWAVWRPEGRSADVLLAGLGIGAVIVAVWWVSGHLGHLDEDPATLEEVFVATNSRRMESLSFVAPLAYALDWLMFFSDTSKLLTIGIVAVAGVVAGSAAVALLSRDFRVEGFRDASDTGLHLAGAALMGVGGVTALGCTIGQGLSGISTLSVGSFIAVAAIIGGAVAALRWQAWRIDRATS